VQFASKFFVVQTAERPFEETLLTAREADDGIQIHKEGTDPGTNAGQGKLTCQAGQIG